MIKCSVYIAISVDGYIARPDGDVSWLDNPAYQAEEGEDFGYRDFIKSVDFLVLGRKSFEKVLTFDDWPYEDLPVVVLSSKSWKTPPELAGKIRFFNAAPDKLVAELQETGAKHLYIDGGITIQRFLEAGLIDEITLTIIPILLGDGIPLFGSMSEEFKLVLQSSKSYNNGFIQNLYLVRKKES